MKEKVLVKTASAKTTIKAEQKEKQLQTIQHTFEPIYDKESKILILGTFPSVKSREGEFYYHHPQNRFWKLISSLTKEPLPETIADKKAMVLKHHIAIWDVIYQCDIYGSSDSSIKNVIPNDINQILENCSIEYIIANGDKAYQLYNKYCLPTTHRECIKMPSTSPANAVWTLERLIESWGKVVQPFSI